MPDGLAVDAEGGVWVALWDGGAVFRLSPEGKLDDVIALPCGRVTACSFGGEGLDELFITDLAPRRAGRYRAGGGRALPLPAWRPRTGREHLRRLTPAPGQIPACP